MRAGLLSDPRVVALLRDKFIPCLISARNTPECMLDARDKELLDSYVRPGKEQFVGGEREVFLLPDGTMLEVFMSLSGPRDGPGQVHMTASGRRSEHAVTRFRAAAERALKLHDGGLPADWQQYWDGTAPKVQTVFQQSPRWPEPAAGSQGFRVFVRNSMRMYDDLHGSEIVTVPKEVVLAWMAPLQEACDSVELPPHVFRDLVQGMLPRGGVAPKLAAQSIGGALVLHAVEIDERWITGRLTGSYSMKPTTLEEAGRRREAASLFESKGTLVGEFIFDRQEGTFRNLRFVAVDVEYRWINRMSGSPPNYFDPQHRIGVEWVVGPVR